MDVEGPWGASSSKSPLSPSENIRAALRALKMAKRRVLRLAPYSERNINQKRGGG